jgi:cell fate regulator YaaT (PSP1 superfamily)
MGLHSLKLLRSCARIVDVRKRSFKFRKKRKPDQPAKPKAPAARPVLRDQPATKRAPIFEPPPVKERPRREVVGVSFRRGGKRYFFDRNGLPLRCGMKVIAETARGLEFGQVTMNPTLVDEEALVTPLKKVVRIADADDHDRARHNRDKERIALECAREKVAELRLAMQILDVEFSFDSSSATFHFVAEERVDFRELVKELTSYLGRKVQMHQVGARDEAKFYGGCGVCGRELCCASFLASFEPISMKMAKEQSLFLNPLKFSGLCGKLMCCLRYEYKGYREGRERLPSVGAIVAGSRGRGKVVELDVLNGTFTVDFGDGLKAKVRPEEVVVVEDKKKARGELEPEKAGPLET